ncbi:hypothetical protein CsatB_003884 [Cannabis sativa]|uniref:BAG family molecular chaperone regulator 1 n=2 Tax=Cannabis sativa TaxID=3483 RepID=A0A7J6IA40_CANSA|nr:hypothetical protein G4B88_014374 [Cannabis sativa]
MNTKFWSSNKSSAEEEGGPSVEHWEIKPGGMLVQKRNSDVNPSSVSTPTIRVRVKYGSSYHEISISSQASFGELKKKLAAPTGVHHEDQKLIFKNKERDSKDFLDVLRVKDGSKIVLVEDVEKKERRLLEMIKDANVRKVTKTLKEINLELSKLQGQVLALEQAASKHEKIEDKDVDVLIEILMSKLIKLDGISAEGDLKQQRRMLVKKVQNYIETLDQVKLQKVKINSSIDGRTKNKTIQDNSRMRNDINFSVRRPVSQKPSKNFESPMVSTKWETFD